MFRIAAAIIVMFLTFGAVPLTAMDTREISGEIMVLERMALQEDTMILVDVSDALDVSLTSFRTLTGDRQSPFDFSLSGPVDTEMVLRVGLRGHGDIFWLSEPVAIPAGSDDVSLGSIRALRTPQMGFASLLSCGNQIFEIGFLPEEVRLRLNEQIIAMQAQPAASGALYVSADNPSTSIHLRGNSALVRVDGAELSECALSYPEPNITQGVWNISAIGDSPTLFPSRTELVFYPDGRMAASVGCNRMVGVYRRHGGILSFGRVASTMMACPEGLDVQERNFAMTLPRVDGFALDTDTGRLTLLSGGQPVLRARK